MEGNEGSQIVGAHDEHQTLSGEYELRRELLSVGHGVERKQEAIEAVNEASLFTGVCCDGGFHEMSEMRFKIKFTKHLQFGCFFFKSF